MDESKLNRIINMIREDMPTNNISSGNIKPATELGDDPIVRKKKKKKKYAYLGPRSRKTWMPESPMGGGHLGPSPGLFDRDGTGTEYKPNIRGLPKIKDQDNKNKVRGKSFPTEKERCYTSNLGNKACLPNIKL